MRIALLPGLPVADAARRWIGWPRSDRFAVSIAKAIVATWVLLALGCAVRGLALAYSQFAPVLVAASLLLAVAAALRARAWPGLAAAVEACALFPLACLAFALLSFVAATSGAPLVDAALARADALLFPTLDWEHAVLAFCRLDGPSAWANACYESIKWQPVCLMLLLCVTGRRDACWRFLAAWIAALAVTVALFAVTPALGAYPHFGIAASDVPTVLDRIAWRQAELLARLRSGALRTIDMDTLDGIVSFPSFHAAAAVLLGWAWWPLRRLRWAAVIGNAAMLLSAIPIGGHYFVDLAAGLVVGVLGIAAAQGWQAAAGQGRAGGGVPGCA